MDVGSGQFKDATTLASRLASRIPDLRIEESQVWVARASANLDLMGGIAEHTGSLVLAVPTREVMNAAVLPRTDQRLRIVCLQQRIAGQNGTPRDAAHSNGLTEAEWPLSALYDPDGRVVNPRVLRELARRTNCPLKLAALSLAHALVLHGHTPHLHGGFTLIIESGWRGAEAHQPLAAALAAVMKALASPLGMNGDLEHIVRICGQAQRSINGSPPGMASASAPLAVQEGCILPIACRPFKIGEPIRLPDAAMVVGVHCGVRHPDAGRKYTHARTTALMGCEIIRRLRDAHVSEQWDGRLSSISVTEYVEQLRDRLPTKLTGRQYLECCGPLDDEDAAIDPAGTYKIRSRAEHHIYEDGRVRQFAERLGRAGRNGQEQCLLDAGDLMYASHWSYGQRCGLGSIETDLLVNLLRQAGPSTGIFGARVSEKGAGGTVVVLARRNREAAETMRSAVEMYQRKTRHPAHLLPMAMPAGAADPFAVAEA